jgi:hypothetical protein
MEGFIARTFAPVRETLTQVLRKHDENCVNGPREQLQQAGEA